MSAISDAEVIAQNPIRDGLDNFRREFTSIYKDVDNHEDLLVDNNHEFLRSIEDVNRFIASSDAKYQVIKLLLALQGLAAANLLASRLGGASLQVDLFRLTTNILSDDLEIPLTVPLLCDVLNRVTDVDIWNAVFTLISRPTTPPQSNQPFTNSFQQMPWSFNTDRFADTSELRRKIDPALKDELKDNLIVDHTEFVDTFFGQIADLPEMATTVFQMCKDSEPPLYKEGIGWAEWPKDCKESKVLDWLSRHTEHFLRYASETDLEPRKRRQWLTTPNQPIPLSVHQRKLNIGLVNESSNEHKSWSHILVPGELKSNEREDNRRSTWFDLIAYVREVFHRQPTRRFVLSFTFCGPFMRLWEFDRLGGVASEKFNINEDGQRFVSTILGYLWMNEKELGFDPTILEGNTGRYIEIQRNGVTEQIYLQELMKQKPSVAGRATTCWRGYPVGVNRDMQLVIKDSWEYEELPEEGLLLKEATEAGVKNIARYYHHETVYVGGAVDDVRNNIRKGLQDADGRNAFQSRRTAMSDSILSSATSGRLDTGGSGSRSNTRNGKRDRSSSSIHTSMPPPKRPCPGSPVNQAMKPQHNRVHRRVIMCDVGKSIYQASSLGAMLTGLLGGVKGHESLLNANILHRDISIGNIMLTEDEKDGFLIDLDLSTKEDGEMASGAPSKTGTKVFMAIGALYGEPHNFMLDLESFFWLFFWICVHWNGPNQKCSRTKYESWNFQSPDDLGQMKAGMVFEQDQFDRVVNDNVTTYCKPLVGCLIELHKILFPEGRRWRKKDRGLYSRIKLLLENTRVALLAGE